MNNKKELQSILPKVSVIVPVYNAERYIDRTIASLMEQTLEDVQFIIIDDGSQDNSVSIINQIIERYPQRIGAVTLITRENRGVAATRAQGLKLASGEYTIHLDSDDWIEPEMLESLYSRAVDEQADIVICDYFLEYENSQVYVKQNQCDNYISGLLTGEIGGFSWNKLIRNSLHKNIEITFDSRLDYLEDFHYMIKIFKCAGVTSHVNNAFVHYNQLNESSITKEINLGKIKKVNSAIEMIESELYNTDFIFQEYKKHLNLFKINQKAWFVICNRVNVPDFIWSLYPETNQYIMSSRLAPHIKISLLLAKYKWYKAARVTIRYSMAIWSIIKKIKNNYLKII
ncbi:glycosyltransferase family 2 protein [Aeromonas media]|uniref:glycosyltransferase family 2 protein n=1 Tax=Aeromonas media TaxID=651 RepID=UPI0038D0F4AF